jgi:hypothetical protein
MLDGLVASDHSSRMLITMKCRFIQFKNPGQAAIRIYILDGAAVGSILGIIYGFRGRMTSGF